MSRHQGIEQQAATWLMRREQPEWSAAGEQAFQVWLDASEAHKAAYWRLDAGWAAADRLAATGETAPRRSPFFLTIMSRYARSPWALAAMLLLIGTASLALIRYGSRPDRAVEISASTPVGGRKDVVLTDGSRVTLNTASALHAAIGNGERRLWLDRGEAYFQVAHDRSHPFVIYAGNRKVTVLGTKFSVRRDGDKVTVAVTEGRVRVETAESLDESAAIVTAGDIAIAEGRSLLVAGRSEQRVEDSLAWRRGVLTFDQVTLAQAAREFNRYNARQIRFGDDHAAQIRIGGSFRADNVDSFARLLQEAFGLHVVTRDDTITINS